MDPYMKKRVQCSNNCGGDRQMSQSKPEPKSKIRCWYRHPHWQLQLSCMPCILYECEAIAVLMHMLGDGVKGVMARCIIN
jgi:hypothetical protein